MTVARTALEEMCTDGTFKRAESAWRNWISNGKIYLLVAEKYITFLRSSTDSHLFTINLHLQKRDPNSLPKKTGTISSSLMLVHGLIEP
jgi:hypothetical protein